MAGILLAAACEADEGAERKNAQSRTTETTETTEGISTGGPPKERSESSRRGVDRAVQSNLRNALTANKVIYADFEDYSLATLEEMDLVEPSLGWVRGTSSSPRSISVNTPSSQEIVLAALGDDGLCYYIFDAAIGPRAGTHYATTESTCDAAIGEGVVWGGTW